MCHGGWGHGHQWQGSAYVCSDANRAWSAESASLLSLFDGPHHLKEHGSGALDGSSGR